MSEPSLNDISDYDRLDGKKKKTVMLVLVAGLIMGIVYVGVNYFFGSVDDSLNVTDSIKTVPYR